MVLTVRSVVAVVISFGLVGAGLTLYLQRQKQLANERVEFEREKKCSAYENEAASLKKRIDRLDAKRRFLEKPSIQLQDNFILLDEAWDKFAVVRNAYREKCGYAAWNSWVNRSLSRMKQEAGSPF